MTSKPNANTNTLILESRCGCVGSNNQQQKPKSEKTQTCIANKGSNRGRMEWLGVGASDGGRRMLGE